MMYSEKQKAEILSEIIVDGKNLNEVARSHKMSRDTLYKWVKAYKQAKEAQESGENTEQESEQKAGHKKVCNDITMPAHERVEINLKKMEEHQLELEQLAYEHLCRKVGSADARELVSLLNVATTQYKSSQGKATECIAVKSWEDFAKDVE